MPGDFDFHADHDGATKALDAIRAGADQLVAQIRQRVWMALDAVADGGFADASSHLADALHSTQALANAHAYIAIADGSRLLKAADVEVGMMLTHVGEVTDVDITPCSDERCRRHVTIKVGEHEMNFRGDQEVYVTHAEGD